jgi:hypothetical protein
MTIQNRPSAEAAAAPPNPFAVSAIGTQVPADDSAMMKENPTTARSKLLFSLQTFRDLFWEGDLATTDFIGVLCFGNPRPAEIAITPTKIAIIKNDVATDTP